MSRSKITTILKIGILVVIFFGLKGLYVFNLERFNTQETFVYGHSTLHIGDPASLRILVLDHKTSKPIRNARTTIKLVVDKKEIRLFEGKTNQEGTIDASFRTPEDLKEEKVNLIIKTSSFKGSDEIIKPVQLKRSYRVLLTTDKPVYQPNQTIMIRALALNSQDLSPVRGQKITLEVFDSKDNKIFKETKTADRFGIVSAEFPLADEINMGLYTVKASLGNTISEKKVNVYKYILPKFKVKISTDKSYYLPSQLLQGEVNTEYFFGKPVASGEVEIRLLSFDVEYNEIGRLSGVANEDGLFKFEFKLPSHFVGIPLEKKNALLFLEVKVKDKTGHQEESSLSLVISKDVIDVIIIPESGRLVSDVENILYVMTTYPDGRPARTKIKVNDAFHFYETDPLGIAKITVLPKESPYQIKIYAQDELGNKVIHKENLEFDKTKDTILLRTDKAIYKNGEVLVLDVFSNQRGNVYIDLVKDKQTILTKSTSLKDTKASLEIDLASDLFGSIQVHAYRITPDGEIIRDTRLIYVIRGDELKIAICADKEKYLPGEEAKITFNVRDKYERPKVSALGVNVVDEAVFYLQEMQPGFEKVYFTLQKELLQPKYEIEIHGYPLEELIGEEESIESFPPSIRPTYALSQRERLRQEAASILFTAVKNVEDFSLKVASWKIKDEEFKRKRLDYLRSVRAFFIVIISFFGLLILSTLLNLIIRSGVFLIVVIVIIIGLIMVQIYLRRVFQGELREATNGIGEVFQIDKRGISMVGGKEASVKERGITKEEVRVRKYFPETLYFNPAVITDENGIGTINISLADSITNWRLIAQASSLDGSLGSSLKDILVFQDFFIDINLPRILTQDDEISLPIAIYNYLNNPQSVRLEIKESDWFELRDESKKSLDIDANDVGVIYFRIKVKKIGIHKLTVYGYGEKMFDAVRKNIEIVPNGEEVYEGINGRLWDDIKQIIMIPSGVIEGASKILVKLYPGAFSQVIEGLENIYRIPHGCFEQTTSVTYPNVLALSYMKEAGQLTPELEMKVEKYINLGYQRLLNFEVEGGGFSLYGKKPAKIWLSAYGLMLFNDMKKVYSVDDKIIERTFHWLLSQQRPNGSWEDNIQTTAYTLWVLLEAGFKDEKLNKGLAYIQKRITQIDDPYTLALCANALAFSEDKVFLKEVTRRLLGMRIKEKDRSYLKNKSRTLSYSYGESGVIETTALVAYLLIQTNEHLDIAEEFINYLIDKKDPHGTWYSTQSTILALRTLISSLKMTVTGEGIVTVLLNTKKIKEFRITLGNDILHQIDLGEIIEEANEVELRFKGKGFLSYQITSKYYLPWRQKEEVYKPVEIEVEYDKDTLSQNDFVTSRVIVSNNQSKEINMLIVDLGIPAGFEVQTQDLKDMVTQGVIERFQTTPRQIILYLDSLDPKEKLILTYRLKARFPIKAKTPPSCVYEYYNPEIKDTAPPTQLNVL